MSTVNEPTIREGDILRPTHLEINLTRLTENYRAIETAVSPAKVMPILKANAYGHGLVEIAKHLEKIGAPYFGVAFLEEGILLRESGIKMPSSKKAFCYVNQASKRRYWSLAAS